MKPERCRNVRGTRRVASPAGTASPLEDLHFIRQTLESAASFTAVSGWGMVAVGAVALAATAAAAVQPNAMRWLGVWVLAAVVGASLSVAANAQKSARSRHAATKAVLRKFLLAFLPPLFAGAVLTILLARAGRFEIIPPMWLLLYGTAVITGGAFSVRLVPVMGACFVAASVFTAALPTAAVNWMMAAAFGGLHLAFGILIARRHGG
jgi:hypothetical protein